MNQINLKKIIINWQKKPYLTQLNSQQYDRSKYLIHELKYTYKYTNDYLIRNIIETTQIIDKFNTSENVNKNLAYKETERRAQFKSEIHKNSNWKNLRQDAQNEKNPETARDGKFNDFFPSRNDKRRALRPRPWPE